MTGVFFFTVPGQPISWNKSYRQKTITVKDRLGRAVLGTSGRPKTRPAQFKTREAEEYQDAVRLLARVARPSGFVPAQVIVAYDFVLDRDIDCDNVMKMVNDALAEALDLNDRHFFPVVLSKTTGSKDPTVHVGVFDRSQFQVSINPL